MDLLAYLNIPNLEEVARKNGIVVPRLRGYTLMAEEEQVSRSEMLAEVHAACIYRIEDMCCSYPRFSINPAWSEYSLATKRSKDKYLIKDSDGHTVGIRWNLLHGKKRKNVKYVMKKTRRIIERFYEVQNKYAGRADVLKVHARIGGGNWPYYYQEVVDKPWFLEKVDSIYDSTYCDIFCRIEPVVLGEPVEGGTSP